MRTIAAVLLSLAALCISGCAGGNGKYIRDYSLVSPAASVRPVYEDADVRVAVKVVDDSLYSIELANKTDEPLTINWTGATALRADGGTEGIGYRLVRAPEGVTDSGGVTTVMPGAAVAAEAFPVVNAYVDEKGERKLYPLYCSGSPAGDPTALDGREIGVNLLVIVRDHARSYPLFLKVNMPDRI